MTRQEMKTQIQSCIDYYERLTKDFDTIKELFGYSYESRLADNVFRLLDDYMDMVSDLVDDQNHYIQWFIFDNDCGKRGISLSLESGNTVSVNTVDELVLAIQVQSECRRVKNDFSDTLPFNIWGSNA